MDEDEEILQDFLTEAGEILEQVSSQLIELENNGDDIELLNGIFRGFHTVKGGASFLNLDPMVEVCHDAEDVFNALRQGERTVDAGLMDVVLRALDSVNTMFEALRSGDELPTADPQLLRDLKSLLPGSEDSAAKAERVDSGTDAEKGTSAANGSGVAGAPPSDSAPVPETDPAEMEFEALLAEAEGAAAGQTVEASLGEAASNTADSGEITDQEFEQLLDTLHGTGTHHGVPVAQLDEASAATAQGEDEATENVNEMTEDEFDALLDQLHGKGGAPGQQVQTNQQAGEPVAEEKRVVQEASAADAASVPDEAPKRAVKEKAKQGGHGHREVAESSIRVETRRLDEIMNLVGELVLVRNRLSTLKAQIDDERVAKSVFELDAVTTSLQDAAMQTRMQPVKKVFGRFPRVVRDLARHLEKDVALELRGEDTDLDKNLVEALADPLVHLVRNAVDHGIEYPHVREAAGKPRKGMVILSAEQEGDHILLEIRDDGSGMDADRLRVLAVEKGVLSADAAERLSDREAFDLIFAPGFSTRKEVSDVSGRGVGMDVVKTSIERLNGKIEIKSELGKGTIISIQVPLTLAILPTLMVGLGSQRFALPLACVGEIFNLDPQRVRRVDGREVVLVRERAVPVFRLNEWFAPSADRDTSSAHVVMVSVSHQRAAFVVDSLIGQEEVVIKPLGAGLHGLPGFAGATITGDGGIALIIDVAGLLKAHARAA